MPVRYGPAFAVMCPLDARRMLAAADAFRFVRTDPTFGDGGVVRVAAHHGSAPEDFVTPLDDGGSIVGTGLSSYRRYDARGRLVTRWGDGGVLDFSAGLADGTIADAAAAADPRTGRLVLLPFHGDAVSLDVYGSDGRLERSLPAGPLGPFDLSTLDALAFDHSGRLLLADGDDAALGRWLPSTGAFDPKFRGGDGVVTLGATTGAEFPSVDALTVGPGDDVTLVRGSEADAPAYTHFADVDRFDVHGRRVATFGDGGHATRTFDSTEDYVTDATATPDGSAYLLEDLYVDGARRLAIRQVRDNGTFAAPIDLGARLSDDLDGVTRLLADGAGRLYVVDGRAVVRYDARRRRFDDGAFNGLGGAATVVAAMRSLHDAAFDAAGRLLLLGVAGNATEDGEAYGDATILRAASGGVANLGVARPGRATLAADGMLDVAGTSGADDIRLTDDNDNQPRVTINGHVQAFARDDVVGIIVHAGAGRDRIRVDVNGLGDRVTIQGGRGNDRIRYGSGAVGLYDGSALIDGGAGDDRISGGTGDDTIYGGDGDDAIAGGAGGDVLYGGAGDDTLAGQIGFDRLDGGVGDDELYANDAAAPRLDQMLPVAETLVGGAGIDRFFLGDDRDDVLDATAEDAIVT